MSAGYRRILDGAARRTGPHRLPARTLAGPDLQGRGVPAGHRRDPRARSGRAAPSARSRARCASCPGIGDTTARVVTEALAGEVPSYLERLELDAAEADRRARGPATRSGPGCAATCTCTRTGPTAGRPVERMARTAAELGHEYLAMTDHSPRLTVAHGLSPERLREQLDLVDRLNEELAPLRILRGIEVDILEDGSLDQEDELLAELDVVVASVHSKLQDERRRDDRAHDRRGREPAHGHPRPLHRSAHRRQGSQGERVRRRARVRRVPASSTRRSR